MGCAKCLRTTGDLDARSRGGLGEEDDPEKREVAYQNGSKSIK